MPQGLREGTAYMVLGFGASMATSFGAQVVASRALGPEAYGLYGLVVSNAALVSGFLDHGLSGAMAAFVAEKDTQRDRAEISSVVKIGIGVEIALAILLGGMSSLFYMGVANRFFSGMPSLVFVSIAIVIIQGFYSVFSGVIQGLRELKYLALIRFIWQASLLLLMYFLIRGLSWGLEVALVIHVLSLLLALCISLLLTRRFLHKHSTNEQKEERFGDNSRWVHNTQAILKFATPISAAAVASSWIQSSGPAIMSYLSNNSPGKQLGILIALLTLTGALDRIVKITARSAFPYLVNWNVKGTQLKTKQYVNLLTLFVVGGYVLLMVGSLLVGDRIIPLVFGRNYLDVARYLPVALLAFCAISLQDIYGISLFSLKAPGLFLIASLAGAFVFITSLLIGDHFFHRNDLIYLILVSIGLANLTIFLGAWLLFRVIVKRRTDLSS